MSAPITGYRTLDDAETALINRIKAHAEETRSLVTEVQNFLDEHDADNHTKVTEGLGHAVAEARLKMKSTSLILMAAAMLTGCGWFDRATATATGYARMCVDGVEYLQFTSGATVAYTRDGKVKACGS